MGNKTSSNYENFILNPYIDGFKEKLASQSARNYRVASKRMRLFVSSTFLDTHREREHILREVQEYLRSFASKMSVNVEIVDLRWGTNLPLSFLGSRLSLSLCSLSFLSLACPVYIRISYFNSN